MVSGNLCNCDKLAEYKPHVTGGGICFLLLIITETLLSKVKS